MSLTTDGGYKLIFIVDTKNVRVFFFRYISGYRRHYVRHFGCNRLTIPKTNSKSVSVISTVVAATPGGVSGRLFVVFYGQ